MAVRNFWLSANVDGRKTILASGPRSKSGGLSATLRYRDHGDIAHDRISIECIANSDGKTLSIRVFDAGECILSKTVVR